MVRRPMIASRALAGLAVSGLCAVLIGWFAGCSSSGGAEAGPGAARVGAASPTIAPRVGAVPVWPGTTLVLAEELRPGAQAPRVVGSGGRALACSLWMVTIERGDATWSGASTTWRAARVEEAPETMPESASLLVAIELPADFAGEEIVVGGRRVAVELSPDLIDAAWISPVPVYADLSPLLEAAAADERNPMLRWRSRLLRAGVPDDPATLSAMGSELLESLAVQEELRWRAGLSRLHRVEPALAAKVRSRLLGRVESQEARLVVPLWNQDARGLDQLRDTLLDDRATEGALISRVEAWLRRQPDGVAWFEDVFAQGVPGATLGFIRAWAGNASDRPLLAWIEFRGQRPMGALPPEPVVLQPGELALLEASVPDRAGESEAVSVEVHVGGRVERGQVIVGSVPATPPGVRLGPLLPAADAGLLFGGSEAGDASSCVGWLRRLDSAGLAPTGVASRSRWSILLECEAVGGVSPGIITLDFIHRGGRTRIDISADGRIMLTAPPGLPAAGYPARAAVIAQAGKWEAEVPVPDWCVGLDGRLRVWLVRRGLAGAMWSWPSRVLRIEPERGGHAAIDLDAWDRGGGEPGARGMASEGDSPGARSGG